MPIATDTKIKSLPFFGVTTPQEEIPPGKRFAFDTYLDSLTEEDYGHADDSLVSLLAEYGIS